MPGHSFIEVNQRIETERRAKFLGTASIRFSSLKPRSAAANPIRRPATKPLQRLFREEHGCRQEDSRHHAKATISQDELQTALMLSGISEISMLKADSLPYPQLEFPPGTRLECIQGCDRIIAADEVFDGANKRWIVDLYLNDISDDLKTLFTEEYTYQKDPEDGEFYCKIRRYQGYHGNENPFFEGIWLGRLSALSKNRRDLLDQLFRHKKYTDAFDALLPIPALFCGFRLTVVHQVISMRCEEPNIHYLKHIFRIWSSICNDDPQIMQLVDSSTVERLQGKAPGAFMADRDDLLLDLESGRIFGNLSEQQRAGIWYRLCEATRQCLVPSLFTFFEDRKFLSPVAECLRRLTGMNCKATITSRLSDMFQGTHQQWVQTSDAEYLVFPGDAATQFDLGCRQLWLAAFREFRDIPTDSEKKERLAKARRRADETTLFEMASLAQRLGFASKEINMILGTSPDRQVAERVLLSARKPGKYRYPEFEYCVQQIAGAFATAQPVPTSQMQHNSEMGQCVEPPARYGIPHNTDHDRDQGRLFLPNILLIPEPGERNVSSFFVRRSVYAAYFGLPP
ncbi:hypothetical protein BGZ63DRAFT_351107, partial [Mariannaea sp. PMI_226]